MDATGMDLYLNGNITGAGTVSTTGNSSVILSGSNSGFTGAWQSTSAGPGSIPPTPAAPPPPGWPTGASSSATSPAAGP